MFFGAYRTRKLVGITEDRQLDWELGTAVRTKPVQLLKNASPIQPSDWIGVGVSSDPNDPAASHPHTDTIRDGILSNFHLIA